MCDTKTGYAAFCPRCGEAIEGHKVLPLRAQNRKYRCPECGSIHYGYPERAGRVRACGKCSRIFEVDAWKVQRIEDWEMLPDSKPCERCVNEMEEMESAVKEGGAFWECVDCGQYGAVKKEHPLAQKVRAELEIEPPELIGVRVSNADCPMCGEQSTHEKGVTDE